METVRINGQDYTSSLSDAELAFMGNFSLPTTAQTLSGAIAEHENDISELNSTLTTYSKNQITDNGLTILCERIGYIVTITVNDGAVTNTTSTSESLFTIPQNYRPREDKNIEDNNVHKRMKIKNDGSVIPLGSSIASGSVLRFTVTYITN